MTPRPDDAHTAPGALAQLEALQRLARSPLPVTPPGLPRGFRCGIGPTFDEPRDAVVDAHFPSATDWQWRGDALDVLHAEPGYPVHDVWYRRGEVLHLESRAEVDGDRLRP